jgi:hypothetical protein
LFNSDWSPNSCAVKHTRNKNDYNILSVGVYNMKHAPTIHILPFLVLKSKWFQTQFYEILWKSPSQIKYFKSNGLFLVWVLEDKFSPLLKALFFSKITVTENLYFLT